MEEFQENDIKDRYILLYYFTEEVWKKILQKVKKAEDFLALINSSPFFRNILLPNRIHCLFPQVWHIFKKELYFNSKTIRRASRRIARCADCFRIRKVRDWSYILTLRLVCKNWRDAVDEFYQSRQNNNYNFSHESQPDGNTWDFVKWTNQEFKTSLQNFPTQVFLRHFEKVHGTNRFLARAVTCSWNLTAILDLELQLAPISASLWENSVEGWRVEENRQILQIISKYGHHLWYCTFEIQNEKYNIKAFYKDLAIILKYLPNIRYLKIVYKGEMKPLEMDTRQSDICKNFIPKLNKLNWLSTYNLPLVILRDILAVNHDISTLEINSLSELPKPFYYLETRIRQIEFSNLKEFSARNLSKTEFLSLAMCKNRWALRKLYLEFRSDFWLEWSKVFKLLEEKWGKTLSNLGIVLPSTIEDKYEQKLLQECSGYKLNLPKLKHLTLVIKNICTLDFILPMKDNLESLELYIKFHIERWGMADDKMVQMLKESQTIQFLGYVGKLLESNIWTLFPKLRQVICLENYENRSDKKDNEGFATFRHVCTRREWCYTRKGTLTA